MGQTHYGAVDQVLEKAVKRHVEKAKKEYAKLKSGSASDEQRKRACVPLLEISSFAS
ncbi:hypothetical protein GCM10009096_19870 [Parasphingorhabdus litoris]|uniref:Uncharacterized protein n=2 Tax=Parasphingorhabdus litoris TaxID=394733 RepID=A0ABN1AJA1_9SPHN